MPIDSDLTSYELVKDDYLTYIEQPGFLFIVLEK